MGAQPTVLTGHKISLTYDRLVHIPDIPGGGNDRTIYDGLGVKIKRFEIDHEGDQGDGGLIIVDTNLGGKTWGVQNWRDSNGGYGLNFWTLDNSNNGILFINEGGWVTMGYGGSGLPASVAGYILYANGGFYGDRIRVHDYNTHTITDLYVSMSANTIFGVMKNDRTILSGRTSFVGGYGDTLTCPVINSVGSNLGSYTITGGYGGNGGDRSWLNYSSVEVTWQRVGGTITGSFLLSGFYGGDSDEPFPNIGFGRPILMHYPVVLLEDDNTTISNPSGYPIMGAASITDQSQVEIKQYSAITVGAFMVSSNNTDDENHGDIRAVFQYRLY